MGLNCKPGDLAMVVRGTKYSGWVVLTHFITPRKCFLMPDGNTHTGEHRADPSWVVESLGSLFDAPVKHGEKIERHKRRYGVIPDAALRPLRDPGDEAVDETLINNPVRHEVTA